MILKTNYLLLQLLKKFRYNLLVFSSNNYSDVVLVSWFKPMFTSLAKGHRLNPPRFHQATHDANARLRLHPGPRLCLRAHRVPLTTQQKHGIPWD